MYIIYYEDGVALYNSDKTLEEIKKLLAYTSFLEVQTMTFIGSPSGKESVILKEALLARKYIKSIVEESDDYLDNYEINNPYKALTT